MENLSERDKKVIWHPYTPMKIWSEAIGIVKGEGAYLISENAERYLDAISSWWVTIHGHAHPYIAKKVSEQLSTLEHCIFAGFTHEPAVLLAERLLAILPGNMQKIFYSDNGSTAVEVALKMALQYWSNQGKPRKKIIALENAYHGDTFGAMSVSGRSIFTDVFRDLLFDVAFIPFPTAGQEQKSIDLLQKELETFDAAALIVEPLVQGSAGMYMYGSDTLEQFFCLCKQYGTLVIADEVMTGFGRTGTLFACDTLQTTPDIICLSKGLTGGTMAMGVTACTQTIYNAFYSDDRSKTLYHGHSFTANPISCAAALASLDLLLQKQCTLDRVRIEDSHAAFATIVKHHATIKDFRQCGTILAIEVNAGTKTSYNNAIRDKIYRYFLGKKIIMRPLGNIIYILPPYCISNEELQYIYNCIRELLELIQDGEL